MLLASAVIWQRCASIFGGLVRLGDIVNLKYSNRLDEIWMSFSSLMM